MDVPLREGISQTPESSSNVGSSSSERGELHLVSARKCHCGQDVVMYTSWTDDNPGRRFIICPRSKGRRCRFWHWIDPEMCERSKEIIPGLLKRLNDKDKLIGGLRKELAAATTSVDELSCPHVEDDHRLAEINIMLKKAQAELQTLLIRNETMSINCENGRRRELLYIISIMILSVVIILVHVKGI